MNTFNVFLSVSNCKYEIQINDFTILFDDTGLTTNTEEPINHLIVESHLVVRFKLVSLDSGNLTAARFTLKIFSKGNKDQNGETFYSYELNEGKAKTSELIITETVAIPAQNYITVWSKGEELQVDRKTIGEVIEGYRQLWLALKKGDLKALREIIILKEENYAVCYGTPFTERINMAMSTYEAHIKDDEYQLYNFEPENFSPKLQCFGKVVSMETEDGFHPVFFLKKEGSGSINIPVYFSSFNQELRVVM